MVAARLPGAGAEQRTPSTGSSSASSAGGCSARPGPSGSWARSASRSTACAISEFMRPVGAAPGLDHGPGLRRDATPAGDPAGCGCSSAGTAATAGCCWATPSGRCPSRSGTWPGPSTWPCPSAPPPGPPRTRTPSRSSTRTGGKQVILVVDGGRTVGRGAARRPGSAGAGGSAGSGTIDGLDLDKTLTVRTCRCRRLTWG